MSNDGKYDISAIKYYHMELYNIYPALLCNNFGCARKITNAYILQTVLLPVAIPPVTATKNIFFSSTKLTHRKL